HASIPTKQGGNFSKNGNTWRRRSWRRTTTAPSASTPWTWNTDLARSTPIVITSPIGWLPCHVVTTATTSWHSDAGWGAVHSISSRHMQSGAKPATASCQGQIVLVDGTQANPKKG